MQNQKYIMWKFLCTNKISGMHEIKRGMKARQKQDNVMIYTYAIKQDEN